MTNFYLIVDMSNLAHASWHAMSRAALTHNGYSTGVIYGVCRTVQAMAQEHEATHILACFDGGHQYRSSIYPEYKAGRKKKVEEMSLEEKASRQELVDQLARLRQELLPAAGIPVIWGQGTEADDWMAAAANSIQEPDQGVVVSSDEDLWQVVRHGVVWCLNPNTKARMSQAKLAETYYGLPPYSWPAVKAWAGCISDEIEGVEGVGDKTAAKYIMGVLPDHTKAYFKFQDPRALWLYQRNLMLTMLPAPGISCSLPDEPTRPDWDVIWRAIGAKPTGATGREKRTTIKGPGLGLLSTPGGQKGQGQK